MRSDLKAMVSDTGERATYWVWFCPFPELLFTDPQICPLVAVVVIGVLVCF